MLNVEIILGILAVVIASFSLLYVAIQVRLFSKQLKLDAIIKLSESNKDLITIGFQNEKFFELLTGSEISSENDRRYLQLWLNHIEVAWHANRLNIYDYADWKGVNKDIEDFLSLPSLRSHWESARNYYSEDFQKYIDKIISNPLPPSSLENLKGYLPISRSNILSR